MHTAFEADDMSAQKYLGAVIGSREYLKEYVNEKVTNWVSEVTKLAEFVLSHLTTSVFCCLHIWPETSLDLVYEKSARYSKFIRAIEEIHIQGAYPCDYRT